MAKNVAQAPVVAKAIARVRKVAQRLREDRALLKVARQNLVLAIEQAQQDKVTRIYRDLTRERFMLIREKLKEASPNGLPMDELCRQCALKRLTLYQLLRQLVADKVVRAPSKGRNARWTLMCDEPPQKQAVAPQRSQQPSKRQVTRQEYEQAILDALATVSSDGVSMSSLRGLLPRGCLLARASQQALGYYLRGLAGSGKIKLIGHARGARWCLVGASIKTSIEQRPSSVTSKAVTHRADLRADSLSAAESNRQFLATVPKTWSQTQSGQRIRPSTPDHWAGLARLVWDLYPHRTFEEFERLVIVYAPYSRYDVSTLPATYREERLREAYLALQNVHGSQIDTTSLPLAVLGRVVMRGASRQPRKSSAASSVVVSTPAIDTGPIADSLAESPARGGARPPGTPTAKRARPKQYPGERFCSHIREDGTRCGAKLRPTNPGPHCSPHQKQLDWAKHLKE